MERDKKREGMKIGGLINIAVGVGLMIFLRALVQDEPVYLCGLIPGLIGVALLTYALFLAPKAGVGAKGLNRGRGWVIQRLVVHNNYISDRTLIAAGESQRRITP